MLNRVVLVGRITRDPELRKTQSGTSVLSFTCAVNRRFQTQEATADFINCVAWNKTAEFMSQYVRKGALIGVDGRIQTRNYDDNTGRKVYVTEVVAEQVQLLESKAASESRQMAPGDFGGGYLPDEPVFDDLTTSKTTSNLTDEVPFDDDFDSSLDISSDDLPF